MSLIDKIENLQKKPESIRRRILFFSITTIMFIIIAVWIFSFNLSSKNEKKEEAGSSPFGVIGGLLKDTYDMSVGSIKEGLNQLRQQFEIKDGNKE